MAWNLLVGLIGGRRVDLSHPTKEEIATFVNGAKQALDHDDRPGRAALAGKPVLVATDVACETRLPDVIPAGWKSSLTEMIMTSVERRAWR